MDAERLRTYLLTLPHTVETVQWGGSLVFWVGDKAIGGKMFALLNLSGDGVLERTKKGRIIAYAAGPERFSELLETEDIVPAPYLARAHWVAVEAWSVFRNLEWEQQRTPSSWPGCRPKPALSSPCPCPAKKAHHRAQKAPRRESRSNQRRNKAPLTKPSAHPK